YYKVSQKIFLVGHFLYRYLITVAGVECARHWDIILKKLGTSDLGRIVPGGISTGWQSPVRCRQLPIEKLHRFQLPAA
ncbi:hypothetical protein V7149_22645, partial [Bacillus sp. JJ1503]|uniref:hypothetical protein n=1 Tax=Bacillus sp. JJ1503 TaxID=3122956 RepID=UPI00300070E8